jgi:hypothetical protein
MHPLMMGSFWSFALDPSSFRRVCSAEVGHYVPVISCSNDGMEPGMKSHKCFTDRVDIHETLYWIHYNSLCSCGKIVSSRKTRTVGQRKLMESHQRNGSVVQSENW